MWVTGDKYVEIYHEDWAAPRITAYTRDASVIWLNVHTGTQIETTGLFTDMRVKRIVFPCPYHNPSISLYSRVFDKDEERLKEDIKQRTKIVDLEISVRWTDDAISESMIFVNPDDNPSKSSKVLVDVYLPYLGTSPRPKFEVNSHYQKRLFSDIKKSFNALWDKAQIPKCCEEKARAQGS